MSFGVGIFEFFKIFCWQVFSSIIKVSLYNLLSDFGETVMHVWASKWVAFVYYKYTHIKHYFTKSLFILFWEKVVYLTKYVATIIPNPKEQNSTLKTSHTMFSGTKYQNRKYKSNVITYSCSIQFNFYYSFAYQWGLKRSKIQWLYRMSQKGILFCFGNIW